MLAFFFNKANLSRPFLQSRYVSLVWCFAMVTSLPTYAFDGEKLYQQCVACHGVNAEGNDTLNAPALAGQFDWYITQQLQMFKEGYRGNNPKDVLGKQMLATTKTLNFDKDVSILSKYIASLPKANTDKKAVDGDTMKNGYRYYQARCGACHGGSAEGNAGLHAPMLSGQSQAYLKRQMLNFQTGIRGTEQSDKYGRQMAMMAKTVSEKELADILIYIGQL